ncbi:hypothetical protein EDD18DRAFT_1109867 [Armillaria luteobubalina]|uniref:NGN domain-containing protein n=1 Tax=Armillaria luteobubalina TaxID=153913 RepID=A0AA39TI43_9AGAR|nr:hypothetical protein EDD18DRAFT_1109867 [Armillaria luteobubalina]
MLFSFCFCSITFKYDEIEQRQWHRNMEHAFLDLEAAVDNDESEDQDSDNELAAPPKPAFEEPEVNGFDEMISGIEERWSSSGTKTSERDKDLSTVDYWLGATINICEYEKNDYPLWRRFREYEAIHHIMSNTDRRINICSILYRHNLRGWIYMEAPYNEAVKSFLLMTPGVRKTGYAPPWRLRVEAIKITEWKTVLQEDDYIEDVFQIMILLIPRLSLEPPNKQLGGKRRHGQERPAASHLFDPSRFRDGADATNQELPSGQTITIFRGHKLLKGFLLKKMSSHGMEEAVNIDVSAAGIFLTSDLPEVQTWTRNMPLPNGWIFNTDERVTIKSLGSSGSVLESSQGRVRVRDASTSTTVETTCWDLCKEFSLGDFVIATVDAFKGHQGWVIEVHETKLDIEVVVLEWKNDGNQMMVEVPWTGMQVNVLIPGHKKERATVEDVVLDPKIPSGLKVTVRYDAVYDPNRPFDTEGVPYEYVTERRCTPPFEGEHPPTSEIITMEDAAWNPRAKVDEELPKDHWIYNEVFKGKRLVVKADGVEKTIWVENDVLWY